MSNRKTSVKRDPLMGRETGLSFDGMTAEEVIALTPDQDADRFLSRWMDVVDPFTNYPRVFIKGPKKSDRLLLEIKRYYKKFVLEEKWPEVKYVLTINNIFETRSSFFENVIEKHGLLYDNEDLLAQRRMRRRKSGR